MGPKSHKFSWSLLTRHLYTRQFACEPQTRSVACLSFAGTKKTERKKRPVLSIEGVATSINMQAAAAAFTVPLCKDKQC